MKDFLKLNRNFFLFQSLLVAFVILVYLFSDTQYVSTVTIQPKLDKATIISENGAPLVNIYSPVLSKQLYLKELADRYSRLEIYRDFLSKNENSCEDSPKIQFYEKNDKSFPISGHFTVIAVKSSCVDFVQSFAQFLSHEVNERVINKIQKIENENLENERRKLILHSENDLSELEVLISNRKEILHKIIPLFKENNINEKSGTGDVNLFEYSKYQSDSSPYFEDKNSVNMNILIPLNRSAAQAELDFLSSITDLKMTSMGLINRDAKIDRYRIKHNFSNSKLVNISKVDSEKVSRRNLFITIFIVFLILGFGSVYMLLNQFKYHINKS
jgi:hypothetical protein